VLRDADLHRIVVVGVEAAGVDERVVAPECRGVDVVAIAGHARSIVDDGDAFASEAVEERGLADVRSTDDRDDGEAVRSGGEAARWLGGKVLPQGPPLFFFFLPPA